MLLRNESTLGLRSHLVVATLVLAIGCGDDSTATPTDTETDASSGSTSPADSTGADSSTSPAESSSSAGSSETGPHEWVCQVTEGNEQDYAQEIGCDEDFVALASLPLDASIAGARSIKTLIDRADENALYYSNSRCYPIHWDFASTFLSGNGLPPVADLATFNSIEYYNPQRRFLLGALTHYEGPDKYAYELSPYDTADAEMIAQAYYQLRDSSYFGEDLVFHPTSSAIEAQAAMLPEDVKVITTDELFADVQYQPYNLGESVGRLTFYDADEVAGQYIPFRDIAVLDAVPIDISITAGIITSEFQTPLAHINVLSVNRGTPNMGLRGAHTNPELLALEGQNVRLTVDAFGYTVEAVTQEEADQWWEENRPDPLEVPPMNLAEQDLVDLDDVIIDDEDLAEQIALGVVRFGAKGTNYAALLDIDEDLVPVQDGFSVPFYYYRQFMEDNSLDDIIFALEAEPEWADPVYREEQLLAFQDAIRAAPVDPAVLDLIIDKFTTKFPGLERIRFRSSTNSEDLGTFTGAGLYDSRTGDIANPASVEDAMRAVWASVWNPRAYEERGYYSIDHHDVGMALLTTPNFSDEEANGVALTNNIFDASGVEPAFYVNVQIGENEVVQPELGVLPDAYLHYFYYPGQPITYITHSSLIPVGQTVMTAAQVQELGVALDAIHTHFLPVYGNDGEWYGMDIEFKFDDKDDPGSPPRLYIKQARPFPWNPGESDISGSGECDGVQR